MFGAMSLDGDGSGATRGRLSKTSLGWFAVFALASVQSGGSAPTPVYHLYQLAYGLPAATVTIIFAVYPISLLVSLLVLGSLSDHVGRRPLMLASMVLSAISMVAFILAAGPGMLVVARVLQGLATGMAASALGAAILDVHPLKGSLINSVTAFAGTTIGALGSSMLVAYAPRPMQLVFLVQLAAFAVLALAVRFLPETSAPRAGAWRSLRPHIAIPGQVRSAFLRVSPVNIAGWALGGFYLSLMPAVMRTTTGIVSPVLGGIVVASLTLSGAAAILAWRSDPAPRILPRGAIALCAGVLVTLAGVRLHGAAVLAAGTLVAGFGFGASFFGAARTILPLAHNHERAGLLSAFYVESYLAFSLPAIVMGFSSPRLGLPLTTYIYGGVIVVLAGVSLVATIAVLRSASGELRS
jgi:MFS family permease